MGNQTSQVTHMSVEVAPATANSSPVYRHRHYKDRLLEIPFDDEPHINSVYKLWARAAKLYAQNNVFGIRAKLPDGTRGNYVWQSYAEVSAEVEAIGTALVKIGLQVNDTVGIFGINSPEWMKAFLGLQRAGCICVPLYDTLGADATSFILRDAAVKLVFLANAHLNAVLSAANQTQDAKILVCFETPTEAQMKAAGEAGIRLLALNEFMALGEETVPPADRNLDDLVYYMYTSGTTGNPKGVQLNNRNLLSNVAGLKGIGVSLFATDVYFSYLPLAHCFEACMQLLGLAFGASVGFYQGNVKLLTDDIACLRPTVFAGVPRVYSRIYEKVQQTLEESSATKRTIFETAYKNQLENVRNGTRNPVWDWLVFNKTKERLGGRIRLMASGAAPLPGHIMDFLKVAFCCEVFQGYGMTENAAAAVVTPVGYRDSAGKVGEPIPSCEIKLEDVPEMNYLHTDTPHPRGEICIRGPNVFAGYHNLPDKTKEALDDDGWLHTGDVGQFLPDGALQIIDRKKNIFKLAQGEYVAAEELENHYKKSKYVGQIWVYGNSFHTTLIAVIVPNPETIMPWCREEGIEGDFATAFMSPKVMELFTSEIARVSKEAKLASFKIPQDVIVESEINDLQQGFSVENDCLTPTFKLRRPQLQQRYQARIDAIYEKRDGVSLK